MKIIAVPVKGKDLKPGDLFSIASQEYWDHIGSAGHNSIGEKLYVRTDTPSNAADDAEALVYRIEIVTNSSTTVEITELRKTCNMCPSQWSGKTSDGKEVYIRFRWGWLYIDIDGKTIFERSYGDAMSGSLTFAELKDVSPTTIKWPVTDKSEDD